MTDPKRLYLGPILNAHLPAVYLRSSLALASADWWLMSGWRGGWGVGWGVGGRKNVKNLEKKNKKNSGDNSGETQGTTQGKLRGQLRGDSGDNSRKIANSRKIKENK